MAQAKKLQNKKLTPANTIRLTQRKNNNNR
jgi:hypothetical protein